MRKIAAVAFTLAFFASPTLAFQCPALMNEIDSRINAANVSDAVKQDARELRREGEELHRAGRHAEAVAVLSGVIELLRTR